MILCEYSIEDISTETDHTLIPMISNREIDLVYIGDASTARRL